MDDESEEVTDEWETEPTMVSPPAGTWEVSGGEGGTEGKDRELLEFARTSQIHIVGCGHVGGEYVTHIHKDLNGGESKIVAYAFNMDPALEEEYRHVRIKRREEKEKSEAGKRARTEGGAGGGGGIMQKIGRVFGFGKDLPGGTNVRPLQPGEGGDAGTMGPTEFEKMVGAISESISGADLVILVCAMEDEAGFEAARVFAEVTKEMDVLSFCYVFLPHGFANVDSVHEANRALQKLRLIVDIAAVLPNSALIHHNVLRVIIQETIELTTTAGLVNVDVADLKATVKGGHVALIGIGESGAEERVKDAVRGALSHQLMLIDYAAIGKAVINVTGGEDMTIDEAEGCSRWLAKSIKEEAHIVWGAEVEKEMEGRLRVFVMAAAKPVEVLLYIYSKN